MGIEISPMPARRLHLPESECSGAPDGQPNHGERECQSPRSTGSMVTKVLSPGERI